MLLILIPILWLLVILVVVCICRVAARADRGEATVSTPNAHPSALPTGMTLWRFDPSASPVHGRTRRRRTRRRVAGLSH